MGSSVGLVEVRSASRRTYVSHNRTHPFWTECGVEWSACAAHGARLARGALARGQVPGVCVSEGHKFVSGQVYGVVLVETFVWYNMFALARVPLPAMLLVERLGHALSAVQVGSRPQPLYLLVPSKIHGSNRKFRGY